MTLEEQQALHDDFEEWLVEFLELGNDVTKDEFIAARGEEDGVAGYNFTGILNNGAEDRASEMTCTSFWGYCAGVERERASVAIPEELLERIERIRANASVVVARGDLP